MSPSSESLPSDLAAAHALILIERGARMQAEAEVARARAANSSTEALIAHLKLEIEKLPRELYGNRSERKARLLDQMELQLEDLEANVVTLVITLAGCLVLLEGAARVLTGVDLFETRDFRGENVVSGTLGGASVYHDTLGWQVVSFHESSIFNTIEYGIRKNTPETALAKGAVLAVGDWFAAGSEVSDGESWPAYLEQRLGIPVMNAGVGAYGTDQIMLRAEELMPVLRPKTLVAGFLQDDILRAGYSSYGAPKPWFSIEDGELVYHSPKLTGYEPGGALAEAGAGRGGLLVMALTFTHVESHLLAVDGPAWQPEPPFWRQRFPVYQRRSDQHPPRLDTDNLAGAAALRTGSASLLTGGTGQVACRYWSRRLSLNRRDMPADYGPPTTVYNRCHRWAQRGIWQRICEKMAAAGPVPEELSIDSSHVKAHRSAQGSKGGRGRKRLARHVAEERAKSMLWPMLKALRSPSR